MPDTKPCPVCAEPVTGGYRCANRCHDVQRADMPLPPVRWPFAVGGPADGRPVPDYGHGGVMFAPWPSVSGLHPADPHDPPAERDTLYTERRYSFGSRGWAFWLPTTMDDVEAAELCGEVFRRGLEVLAEQQAAAA